MNKTYAAESCQKLYGFYDAKLLLETNDRNGSVKIKSNSLNYTLVVGHLFPDLKYSIFERAIFDGPNRLTNDDILVMRNELIKFFGVQISRESTEEAIRVAALKNKFNPLKDYLAGLTIDGSNHLDTWLTAVCGAKDTPINRILGRKWLVSAVARAMKPGCYVEGSMIFFGKQAAGKSRLIKTLNPIESYYCASNVNISNNRDASQAYQGKFIVEFAELSQIRRGELEDVKRFLTESIDTFVPKYSNLSESVPRMMVFAGSTNEPDILVDTTGNRRFWAVEVGDIDIPKLEGIKEALWAEAYQAFTAGEQWTLTEQERELLDESNVDFESDDPLTDYLASRLEDSQLTEFRSDELMDLARPHDSRVHPKAIAKSMRRMGYERKQVTSGAHKGRAVYVSPTAKGWN